MDFLWIFVSVKVGLWMLSLGLKVHAFRQRFQYKGDKLFASTQDSGTVVSFNLTVACLHNMPLNANKGWQGHGLMIKVMKSCIFNYAFLRSAISPQDIAGQESHQLPLHAVATGKCSMKCNLQVRKV